ncbi:MAG: hypothetical protein ACOC5T_07850 [Elusimicrobiota bacterium]
MIKLCKRDEYGASSIVESDENLELLLEKMETFVSNDNMNNALTLVEKLKNFTSVFIEFSDRDGNPLHNIFYAGKRMGGKNFVYVFEVDEDNNINLGSFELMPLEKTDCITKFFIGTITVDAQRKNKNRYYVTKPDRDHPNTTVIVNDVNDMELQGKEWYYIDVV